MIKITKQHSLLVQATTMLVVGMLSIPMFQALTEWLGGFVWPWSPWEHWYGWICYAVIWVYAFMAWLFCWISQYVMWLTPIATLMMVIDILRERRKLIIEGYKKLILYQTRQLAKSWQQDRGFGKDQTSAFLNAVNLALTAKVHKKDLQMWFLMGFRQGNKNANRILDDNEFEILYPSEEGKLANRPDLWSNGKPCQIH